MEISKETGEKRTVEKQDIASSNTLVTEDTLVDFFEDAKPPNSNMNVLGKFDQTASNTQTDSNLNTNETKVDHNIPKEKNEIQRNKSTNSLNTTENNCAKQNTENNQMEEVAKLEDDINEDKPDIVSDKSIGKLKQNTSDDTNEISKTKSINDNSGEQHKILKDTEKIVSSEHQDEQTSTIQTSVSKQSKEQGLQNNVTDTESKNLSDKEQPRDTSPDPNNSNIDQNNKEDPTNSNSDFANQHKQDVVKSDETKTSVGHDKSSNANNEDIPNKKDPPMTISEETTKNNNVDSAKIAASGKISEDTKDVSESGDTGQDVEKQRSPGDKEKANTAPCVKTSENIKDVNEPVDTSKDEKEQRNLDKKEEAKAAPLIKTSEDMKDVNKPVDTSKYEKKQRNLDEKEKESLPGRPLSSVHPGVSGSLHSHENDTSKPNNAKDNDNHRTDETRQGKEQKCLESTKTDKIHSVESTESKFNDEISPPLISIHSQMKNSENLATNINEGENKISDKLKLDDTKNHRQSEVEDTVLTREEYKQNENENTNTNDSVESKPVSIPVVDESNTRSETIKNKSETELVMQREDKTGKNTNSTNNDQCDTSKVKEGGTHSKESEHRRENNISCKDISNRTDTLDPTEHSLYFTGRLPSLEPCDNVLLLQQNKAKTDEQISNHANQENKSTEEIDTRESKFKSEQKPPHDNWALTALDETNDDKSTVKSTPSSVQESKKLINDINAPSQMFQMSKEKPLTPKDNVNTDLMNANDKKAIGEANTTNNNELLDTASKPLTVNDVNQVTSSVMEEDFERHSVAKYDDLPHMKKITEYTDAMKIQKTEGNEKDKPDTNTPNIQITRTITDLTQNGHDKQPRHSREGTISPGNEIEQTAKANQQNTSPDKTSHSETDLKEMIAAAKRAIDDETTTDIKSGFNTTTITSSGSAWQTEKTSTTTNNDGLICSRCLSLDADFTTSGFCHDCQEYLCGKCKELHQKSEATMYHYIMESYCTNELKVRKYIRATGYCKECGIFLCGKCTVQHTGFRAFRRHKIIQSSFIARQAKSKALNTSTTSLDTASGESCNNYSTRERKDKSEERKRKRYIEKLKHNNQYGMNSSNVSESLYPGPDRKLAISYVNKPHWPYSSIPTLPYLVKPGSMNERAMNTPYLKNYRTPFYTKSKYAFEPQAVKMRALQSRYNSPARKSLRRREAGLYTARPLRNHNGEILPDLTSIRSYNTKPQDKYSNHGGTIGEKAVNTANKLKRAEYLRDKCLSIPFPSNELPCLISKMEILLDGRLVVLDKRNNNIKLFTKSFDCKAVLGFQSRLVDMCSSNIYPTDIYVATPKHIHEISVIKGMDICRKIKVEVKRIEGIVCWKYGVGVVFMKDNLSWELRLLDYRGNLKSKLEIINPFTCEIEKSRLYHMVPSRGGKYVTLSDKKNACAICVDVTTRCVVSETHLLDSKHPSYLTSDHQNNVFVSCEDEIQQISAKGRNLGKSLKLEGESQGRVGCIVYNASNDRLYVQIKPDIIAIYQMRI